MNNLSFNMNPIFFIDFYKTGHIIQYPQGVEQVWTNWTPRTSRVPGVTSVVNFGLTYFIKRFLIQEFNKNFFGRDQKDLLEEYKEVIGTTLNKKVVKMDHIKALHDLGYLPLKIWATPEGFSTPLNVPSVILTNTRKNFFWLPNYFETLMSNTLWKPSTSATTAKRFRKMLTKWAIAAGETDFSFIDWQGHDFSMRGTSGLDDTILSGMGHLTSFSGTDSLPAIIAANGYYNADLTIGGSVDATEHSVMSAGSQEGEFETFERLLTEVCPEGFISIVSDTWDLWKVLTNYVPRLKDVIMLRDGKMVIRPDSGKPIDILTGNPDADPKSPEGKGVLRLLAEVLGTTQIGKTLHINKAGSIYGDSITVESGDAILERIVNVLKISPYNQVFGIGSFTYEYVTRDTYGFAMKATAIRKNNKVIPIFKKPVTDNGGKFSHKGIVAVYRTEESTPENPIYYAVEESSPGDLDYCAFSVAFENSKLLVDPKFSQIRERIKSQD